MTQSLYIVGGAGVGKSTFTAELIDRLGGLVSGLLDVHAKANARGSLVTLRGHQVMGRGLYLGHMRPSFPGTDGLDRASSITLEEWADRGGVAAYGFILAEGATLSTRRALGALSRHSELLVAHLWASDEVRDARCAQRGSNQPQQFLRQTSTRARNRADEVRAEGGQVMTVDTGDPDAWDLALDLAQGHLQK